MTGDGPKEPSWWRLFSLAAVFFIGMTAMEVFLEGVMRHFKGGSVGLLVTLSQFTGCSALALVSGGARAEAAQGKERPLGLKDRARAWMPYLVLSCLIWGGTGLANVAVSWVQYPVKVVFKSSKLIPTMVVSVLMGNSRPFRLTEYIAAALLCAGSAGFSFRAGTSGASGGLITLGICFLVCTMFCDAISGNEQQRLMQRTGVPPMAMMLWLNLCGMMVSIAIIICSGEASSAVHLIVATPEIVGHLVGIGLCIAVGVWANTQLINESGSVVAVATATVRKVATIILSYIIYPKPIRTLHVFAAALIVVGLVVAELCRKPLKAAPRPSGGEEAPLVRETEGFQTSAAKFQGQQGCIKNV